MTPRKSAYSGVLIYLILYFEPNTTRHSHSSQPVSVIAIAAARLFFGKSNVLLTIYCLFILKSTKDYDVTSTQINGFYI